MVTDTQTTSSLSGLVVEELHNQVKTSGSRFQAAKDLGITPSMVTEILKGRRPISESVADKLGFERITFFVRKEQAPRVVNILSEILNENVRLQKVLDRVLSK